MVKRKVNSNFVPSSYMPVKKTEPTQKEMKIISIGSADDIDSLTSHHYAKGANAGKANKDQVVLCMDMLLTGFIHFIGAYHDRKKKLFYTHLATHYKEFGLEVPALK